MAQYSKIKFDFVINNDDCLVVQTSDEETGLILYDNCVNVHDYVRLNINGRLKYNIINKSGKKWIAYDHIDDEILKFKFVNTIKN